MLTLNDGRSELWQWDTGRTLAVDADCSQVHFSNKIFGRSIDVDVVDGVAIVPDILLQTDKELTAWAFVGTAENGYTKISKVFKVNKRNKPADYVFTPTEQTTLGELIERLDKIEESQEPDAIKNAVDDYLANNPIEIDEADPTVPEWAKQPTKPIYTASEVGALPADTVIPTIPDNVSAFRNDAGYLTEHQDLTGYATEKYVQGYAQPKGDYLTEVPDAYATKEFVTNKIAEAELGGEEVDMSGYAQKSELPTKVSQLENDSGYLTEHQDISGKLDANKLPEAINTALAQAKASGEFNGKDGIDGVDGKDGQDGSPGKDGSDGVSVTHSWNGTVLTVTSASGTSSADLKGEKGDKGDKGDSIKGDKGDTGATGSPGTSVTVKSVSESTADGGSNVVTFSDGKTVTIKNGSKGSTGAKGADGYTPQKNVDYFDGKDAVLTMFISPDGDDGNDGLTASTPKKTVMACVNAGATRISAKRGIYKEAISLQNIGSLEISPTGNEKTYVGGEYRQPIIFDTSDTLAVSALASYNSIKRIAYNNAANAAYDKVFVKKTLAPTVSASQSSYHAALWLFSNDEKTVCLKPKPVMTIAECEAETNTFCYSGGYIYINADMSGVTKIIVPTISETGFYVNGADKLALREVEVRFSGEYTFDLQNCAFVDLYKCASKYTTRASGFHPVNTNGTFRACYATKCFDGFAPNGHGHTTYIDCVSEYNFDDGMSHHSGTEGTVIGGRYEGNGKGGNTPAYGANVNIYGGLYRNNAQWGVGYVGSVESGYASGMVQGAVMADNPIGIAVQQNCDVIAMNCVYKGNTTDKDAVGNLTEYEANFVKTVNGVEPDGNGNVNVEGAEVVPAINNVLKSAIDTDGSVFNGTGYKNGFRLNSSATEKEQSTSGYTGFIKITPNQSNTIRMKNLELCSTGHHYVHGYDASFTRKDTALQNDSMITMDENGVVTFEVNANWEYIRISTGLMNEDTIITINEPIE